MTASPEALAPTHRPSPRAVVLAILGVALLALFVYGTWQFVQPTAPEPQRFFTVPIPRVPGATIVEGTEGLWVTRDHTGTLSAVYSRSAIFVPASAVPASWLRGYDGACWADGFFLILGVGRYALNGSPLSGSFRPMTRYETTVDGSEVRIDLGRRPVLSAPRCIP